MARSEIKKASILNRRAHHDYEIMETVEAGLVLSGPEVKSVRAGTASLAEAFGRVDRGEVHLYNMYIAPYAPSRDEGDPRRPRKLLLHRAEIRKLEDGVQHGLAMIPLRLYFRKNWAKVELALGRGRRKYDKRERIKTREAEREIKRGLSRR